MDARSWSLTATLALLPAAALLTAPASRLQPVAAASAAALQEKGGQEEFGPYEVVENWPQPLQDGADGVKHDGWT